MNRLLHSICRPSPVHSLLFLQSPKVFRPIAMAQLSNDTMAHASAVVGNGDTKPSTWQGAGAAEFDLRSMTEPEALQGSIRL